MLDSLSRETPSAVWYTLSFRKHGVEFTWYTSSVSQLGYWCKWYLCSRERFEQHWSNVQLDWKE